MGRFTKPTSLALSTVSGRQLLDAIRRCVISELESTVSRGEGPTTTPQFLDLLQEMSLSSQTRGMVFEMSTTRLSQGSAITVYLRQQAPRTSRATQRNSLGKTKQLSLQSLEGVSRNSR